MGGPLWKRTTARRSWAWTCTGAGWHDATADRDRKIRAHLHQLQALGLDVTITPAAT